MSRDHKVVLKVQVMLLARGFPERSLIAVVMVTVNVSAVRTTVGLKVIVSFAHDTFPSSTAELNDALTWKEDELTVEHVKGSVNVAVTTEFKGTSVAPLAGLLDAIPGGVASATGSVVNVQVFALANALPLISLTPVVRVAV